MKKAVLLNELPRNDLSAPIRRSPSSADQNDGISDGIEAIHTILSDQGKRSIPSHCD